MSSIVKTPHSHEPLKIFAFVGHSNTGKTRLIKHLVPELKRRGYSVAVIKHCAYGFSFDPEGKDSRLFMEAGSDGVAMVSPDLAVVSDVKVAVDRPIFSPNDISKIADFLESNFEFRKPRVFLNIDGASIPLNAFV